MWEGRMGPPLPEGKGTRTGRWKEEAKRISLGPVTSIKRIFSLSSSFLLLSAGSEWDSNLILVGGMTDCQRLL